MNIGDLFSFVGIIAGLYCLYAYFMMVRKRKINESIFIPKEKRLRKCKDVDAYIKETSKPLLVLSLVLLFYGGGEIVNEYYMPLGIGLSVMSFVVVAAFVWVGAAAKKANQRYFED